MCINGVISSRLGCNMFVCVVTFINFSVKIYINFFILLVTIAPCEVKTSGPGSNYCLCLELKNMEMKVLIMCKRSRIAPRIAILEENIHCNMNPN